jgi:hypothetical protein
VDEETAEEDFEEVERESATDDALLARLRESMELLAAERERKSPSREKAAPSR